MTTSTPTLHPAFPTRPYPLLTHGAPHSTLLAHHLPTTLHAKRIYILASTTLATTTHTLTHLISTLESSPSSNLTIVGTRTNFSPHTHWNEVIACAQHCRSVQPDCIVTLGAGTLTDAAKLICWMLANDGSDVDSISGLESMCSQSPSFRHDLKPPRVKHVAVPTTLSGGEYQSLVGATRTDDNGRKQKYLFEPPALNPYLVVLDPELTTTTPSQIWLSTGIRAVDHCVETLCSLLSNPAGDISAAKGLGKLIPGLLRTKRDPKDLEARFETMMGVVEAMSAVGSGVPMGASHAIGHQLGAAGVGHGVTSCVLLPAVCKWNAAREANVERQVYAKRVLMGDEVVRALVTERFRGEGRLVEGELDLGDILDVVIRELGLPRTLKEVGVGRDMLEGLARNSLNDHWIKTNAVPITEMEQVMEILGMMVE